MDKRQIGNNSICDNTQWPKKRPIGTGGRI